MDRNTLSHYGWIIVLSLVVAILLAMATPFGEYFMDGVTSIAKGFIDSSDEAFGDEHQQGIVDRWENEFIDDETVLPSEDVDDEICPHTNTTVEGTTALYTGDTFCTDCGKLIQLGSNISNAGGVIPTGGRYIQGAKVYQQGEYFPELKAGDQYIYENYTYIYDQSISGWRVTTTDKTKTSYGNILRKINGKNIVSTMNAFENCTKLTEFPTIPNTVDDMAYTFKNCTSLTFIPSDLIGENATDITGLFYGCTNVYNDPMNALVIPDSTTETGNCFDGTNRNIYITGTNSENSTSILMNMITENTNIGLTAKKENITSNTALLGPDYEGYSAMDLSANQIANAGWAYYKFVPTKSGYYCMSSTFGSHSFSVNECCLDYEEASKRLLNNASLSQKDTLEDNGMYDSYGILLTKTNGNWTYLNSDDDNGGLSPYANATTVTLTNVCNCGEQINGITTTSYYTFLIETHLNANQEYYLYIVPYSPRYALTYTDYPTIYYCNY